MLKTYQHESLHVTCVVFEMNDIVWNIKSKLCAKIFLFLDSVDLPVGVFKKHVDVYKNRIIEFIKNKITDNTKHKTESKHYQ